MAVFHLLAAACLLAYGALLGTPYLDLPGRLLGGGPLFEIRSLPGAWSAASSVLFRVGLLWLRAAPLGALAVFALPDREGRLSRLLRVALPATVVALILLCLSLSARAGWTRPGPFELILPGAGVLLGLWAGLAWRRGWWSRLVFLPKLAALGVLLVLAGLALAVAALEHQPAVPERPPIASAEKRHLVSLFRGKDPRRVPSGETRTVRLSGPELDQLVSWVASVGIWARTAVSLAPGGVSGAAALHVPRTGRWLNVIASTRVAIDRGRLSLAGPRVQVGRLTVPPVLLDVLAPFVVAGLQGDRDLRRVLPAVESLRLDSDEAVLTYRRVDMPRGLIARLVWGEEPSGGMREAVYGQVDRLLAVLPTVPAGDARFEAALETAFALARDRSVGGSAVEENRAALLALGIVLGHPRVARAVGDKLDARRAGLAEKLRSGTTLRGRADWTRHFAVSGALTVVSAVAPSDAAGLLKEELDADGGSGFSFADLLADRAGTTFAEVATRDEARAAALQARLSAGFWVDEFFPPADGLPEGIPDAQLQAHYGGVGGPLYRRTAEEIERRVAACAAYR
ncbi:MAG TPA: hypothetical protein VLL75_07285 [Vicinamibacteria bacterium]|nr:hypothetical protein [Vicinamibacteria bacterium]